MKFARLFPAFLGSVAVLVLAPRVAHAQQHIDIALEANVAKRWLTSRGADGGVAGPNAGLSPGLRLTSHLAILPLFRAGASVQFAYSPVGNANRFLFGGGLDFRGTLPFQIKDLRPFIGFGFDYRRVVQASPQDGPSRNGGYLAVPVTVGAMYKFRKPYEIGGLLGLDLGFAWHGGAYSSPGSQGNDAAALWLAFSMGFDG